MSGTSEPVRLIADIGGTNARFALLTDGSDIPCHEQVLAGRDYPDIVTAIETYLSRVGGSRPQTAAIAIANPITGDWIKMTNHSWAFSIEQTRRQLGLDQFLVLNDFTALAMSLPWLSSSDFRQVGSGKSVRHGPIGVLGPGTGLGVSGLIHAGDRWIPLQGEGGHCSVSPTTVREAEILNLLWQRFDHVSTERLVSGMGLQNLHAAISELAGREPEALTPAEIALRGQRDNDPIAAEALATFCALLGTAAGNLALTLGATGGIYIGGGIVPRLGAYFDSSPFRDRFEAKGRFRNYLAAVPTFVIQAGNPAFLGVAKVFGPYRSVIEELQH